MKSAQRPNASNTPPPLAIDRLPRLAMAKWIIAAGRPQSSRLIYELMTFTNLPPTPQLGKRSPAFDETAARAGSLRPGPLVAERWVRASGNRVHYSKKLRPEAVNRTARFLKADPAGWAGSGGRLPSRATSVSVLRVQKAPLRSWLCSADRIRGASGFRAAAAAGAVGQQVAR